MARAKSRFGGERGGPRTKSESGEDELAPNLRAGEDELAPNTSQLLGADTRRYCTEKEVRKRTGRYRV
jgi:hypothetical protein